MPKPNRPLVRDGRIQAPKKRTDRSYLRPGAQAPEPAPVEDLPEDELDAAEPEMAAVPEAPAAVAAPEPAPTRVAPAPAASAPSTGRLPTSVRAIQQQGVRKRREVDLGALARRDTSYAYHELRRITVLATMVIVTLVVLWFVLR